MSQARPKHPSATRKDPPLGRVSSEEYSVSDDTESNFTDASTTFTSSTQGSRHKSRHKDGTRKNSASTKDQKKARSTLSQYTDDQSDASSTLSSSVSSWLSGVPDFSESTASSMTSVTSVSTLPATRKKPKKARRVVVEEDDSEDSESTVRAAPRSKGKSSSRQKGPTGKELLDDLDRRDSSEDDGTIIASVVKKRRSKGKKSEISIISDDSSTYSDASSALTESNLSMLSVAKKGKKPEKTVLSDAPSAYTGASSAYTDSTFSMTSTLGPDDSVTVVKKTRPAASRNKTTPGESKSSKDLALVPANPGKLRRSQSTTGKSKTSSTASTEVSRLPWYKRLFSSDTGKLERERFERAEKIHQRRIENNDKRFQQYVELKKEFIKASAPPGSEASSSRTRRRSQTITASSETSTPHSSQWVTPARRPTEPPNASPRQQFDTVIEPVNFNLRPNEPTPKGWKLTYASDELTNNGRGIKTCRNYQLDPSHASSSRSAPRPDPDWPRLGRSNSTGSRRTRSRPPPPPPGPPGWMPSPYGMSQNRGMAPPVLPFMPPGLPGYMPSASAARAPGFNPWVPTYHSVGGFPPGVRLNRGCDDCGCSDDGSDSSEGSRRRCCDC